MLYPISVHAKRRKDEQHTDVGIVTAKDTSEAMTKGTMLSKMFFPEKEGFYEHYVIVGKDNAVDDSDKITVTEIVIVCDNGPDTVMLTTTLPSAVYPYKGFQTIKMDVAAGNGEKYVKEHFPNVPCKIIKI